MTGTGVAVMAMVVVVVVGAAAGVVAVVAAGRAIPDRNLMVLSSRRAVVRVAGRVPYHPGDGSSANVWWSLCRTEGGGMIDVSSCKAGSSGTARGRREASTVSESKIP